MTTIVNTPAPSESSGNATGAIMAIVVLAVLAFLFLYFGLPALNRLSSPTNITVPESVDINVNTPSN